MSAQPRPAARSGNGDQAIASHVAIHARFSWFLRRLMK